MLDFNLNPLDEYRKKASFEWKKLKMLLHPEQYAKLQDVIMEKIYKYPEFRRGFCPESLDEKRRITQRQLNIIKESRILDREEILINLNKMPYLISMLTILAPDTCIKFNGSVDLFNNAILALGTEDQLHYVFDNKEGKINGTFCLTEIGHGTNTKGMQTTAVYDIENEEFVINSSCFEAAKCWAAGLSQTASHAIVFAQLIVKGEMKGLHGFIVPLRDPTSLIPYPGLTIGDMGEKTGLNGIDNGFLVFHNYRIPRKNLLSKTGGVTLKGDYITSFKDSKKKHGVSLGHLSIGRTYIVCTAAAYGIKALTIAVRYAAIRKQFGPNESEEVSIIEYQTHQHRLLPHLACAYAIRIFGDFILPSCCQFIFDSLFDSSDEHISERGMEIHSICCGAKPLASWSIRDVIQECREACGGHGYLKAAGIGDLRDNNDANCTFEGDNTVIIQQTSNWLLKFWPLVLKQSRISSPMSSVDFLTSATEILEYKWEIIDVEQLCSPNNLIQIYQWLVCYLLRETYEKSQKAMQSGIDPFWVKNNHQVFLAKNLSIAYTQVRTCKSIIVRDKY
ncbi:hypothetical protein WA026_016103 [Henosepilachna vigintioctopunctata]|uniref:Acyl-coenzyme A oxidase n=1 Tax=Henosepilachna vigintioctopunctata TaxID=420089 RepID=A0AAW1U3L4_9CUCU